MLQCNLNLQKLIDLSKELIALSEDGDMDRDDTSCGVLYGLARDYGNRLLREANEEYEKHIAKGKV